MENSIRIIKETLDKVRPQLQADGGDVQFVKFEEGLVYVNLQGACTNCAYATVTLHDVIENILVAEVPGVIGVELA